MVIFNIASWSFLIEMTKQKLYAQTSKLRYESYSSHYVGLLQNVNSGSECTFAKSSDEFVV